MCNFVLSDGGVERKSIFFFLSCRKHENIVAVWVRMIRVFIFILIYCFFSGVHWLSSNLLVSASIDQRAVIWKVPDSKKYKHDEHTIKNTSSAQISLCSTKTKDSDEILKSISYKAAETTFPTLTPVSSCFMGVPDVKGIAVVDVNSENITTASKGEESRKVKRLFVYGMGLQVYDIVFGGDT